MAGCGGEDTRPTAPPVSSASLAATGDAAEKAAQPGGGLFTWEFSEVDARAKASVAVGADGFAHVAYMLEAMPGWIKYGQRDGDGWAITQVTEGYFYGPLSMVVDAAGAPWIVWHDHQDNQFKPELGDQVLATFRDGPWGKEFIENFDHAGWDNSIVLDAAGESGRRRFTRRNSAPNGSAEHTAAEAEADATV